MPVVSHTDYFDKHGLPQVRLCSQKSSTWDVNARFGSLCFILPFLIRFSKGKELNANLMIWWFVFSHATHVEILWILFGWYNIINSYPTLSCFVVAFDFILRNDIELSLLFETISINTNAWKLMIFFVCGQNKIPQEIFVRISQTQILSLHILLSFVYICNHKFL